MQARAPAIGEGLIMHAALTVQPSGPQCTSFFIRRIFRRAKTHLVVKRGCLIHICGEAVEMVDAQGFHALILRILLMN